MKAHIEKYANDDQKSPCSNNSKTKQIRNVPTRRSKKSKTTQLRVSDIHGVLTFLISWNLCRCVVQIFKSSATKQSGFHIQLIPNDSSGTNQMWHTFEFLDCFMCLEIMPGACFLDLSSLLKPEALQTARAREAVSGGRWEELAC